MRRFPAHYLKESRRGLWAGDRSALAGLDLPNRRRVLDVGCGRGAFGRVLLEESAADVLSLDADISHLGAAVGAPVGGDAHRLPITDGSVDLAACQALLVNVYEPGRVLAELARVSSELVAAVEPDNAGVSIESTVADEAGVARRARSAYLAGVKFDASLGAAAADAFRAAGLADVKVRRHEHVRTTEPPYSPEAFEAARRKARAGPFSEARDELVAGVGEEGYDDLRTKWRAVGREAVSQMHDGCYRRTETVPIYVTVGRT